MRILVAAALLALVGACGSDPKPSEPASVESTSAASGGVSGAEDAVRTLMTAVDAGSCAAVKDIVVTPATVDCEQVKTLAGSYDDADLGAATFAAGPVEGDSTVVTVSWTNGDPDETWDAERIGGTWKVLYDSVE